MGLPSRYVNTEEFIAEAKARARAALKQKNIKLTELEKPFLRLLKETFNCGQQSRKSHAHQLLSYEIRFH